MKTVEERNKILENERFLIAFNLRAFHEKRLTKKEFLRQTALILKNTDSILA